jgi:hypothetical protein
MSVFQEEIMQSQFRVGNLGLSQKSTRQLSRLIDDAAWITYPAHLAVGIVKTFLFILLLIGAVILYTGKWMLTAHDDRADLIQNFSREQTIYRLNSADATISVVKAGEFAVDKDTFASVFTGCENTDSSLKHTTWWERDWLNEKSDMFQAAYIRASRNIAALRSTLGQVRDGRDFSFRWACFDAVIYGQGIKIPNAPVVNIAFLHRTDRELESPANALYNHFTGMCLASANCTDADYLPRNASIYADALYHQTTANQAAALKALYNTGSPDFWVETAHANGIYDDALIASYARKNQEQLENDILRHVPTYEEQFQHEAEIAIGCCLLFICGIGVLIARALNSRAGTDALLTLSRN